MPQDPEKKREPKSLIKDPAERARLEAGARSAPGNEGASDFFRVLAGQTGGMDALGRASQVFEGIAQGQQAEASHLTGLASNAAKIREQGHDTTRKDAKAQVDIATGMMKAQGEALDLQRKKAETSAIAGVVDDTDADATLAAVQLNPMAATIQDAANALAGRQARQLGNVDPRNAPSFDMLRALQERARVGEADQALGLAFQRFREGAAQANEKDLFNTPLGRGGIVAGGLLNALSLPVTLFTGGQGLGTQLLGDRDVEQLNEGISMLRAVNPVLTRQAALAGTEARSKLGARNLALRNDEYTASLRRAGTAGAADDEFVTAWTDHLRQDIINQAGALRDPFFEGVTTPDGGDQLRGLGFRLLQFSGALDAPGLPEGQGKAARKSMLQALEVYVQSSGIEIDEARKAIEASIENMQSHILQQQTVEAAEQGTASEQSRHSFILKNHAVRSFVDGTLENLKGRVDAQLKVLGSSFKRREQTGKGEIPDRSSVLERVFGPGRIPEGSASKAATKGELRARLARRRRLAREAQERRNK